MVSGFFIASVCLPMDLIFLMLTCLLTTTHSESILSKVHIPSNPSRHDQGTPQTGNELTAALIQLHNQAPSLSLVWSCWPFAMEEVSRNKHIQELYSLQKSCRLLKRSVHLQASPLHLTTIPWRLCKRQSVLLFERSSLHPMHITTAILCYSLS